jgi:nucleoid-associated protein YgaU
MARVAAGLGALVVLVAILVGIPILLVVVAGWPLPTAWPSARAVGEALTGSGLAESTVVKAVALVMWLAWLQLVVAVAVELVVQVTARARPRWRLLGPTARLVAPIVTAVLALVGPGWRPVGAAGAAVAPTQPAPRVTGAVSRPLALVVPLPAGVEEPAGIDRTTNRRIAPVLPVEVDVGEGRAPATPSGGEPETWTVGRRDTLWGIAERALGEGERWRDVARANAGREVAPGVVFDDGVEVLTPGWRLVLPVADAAEGDAEPAKPKAPTEPNESTEVVPEPIVPSEPESTAEPSVPTAPAPGGELVVPAAPTLPPAPVVASPPFTSEGVRPRPATRPDTPTVLAPAARFVRVRPGDTLVGLARRWYGDGAAWTRIWEANRGRTFEGRTFDDPNVVYAGWALDLPLASAPETPLADESLSLAGPEPVDVAPPVDVTPPVDVAPPAVARPIATTVRAITLAAPATTIPAIATTATSPVVAPIPPPTSPSTAPPPTSTTAPASRGDRPMVAVSAAPATAGDEESSAWPMLSGITGATLLATGLTGLVGSRRRRRLERMATTDELPPPDPDLVPVERAARSAADPLAAARLDVALRSLVGALRGTAVRPVAVRRSVDGALHAVLSAPAGAPLPWLAADEASTWTLPATVPIDALAIRAAGIPSPCPALVELGVVDGEVLHLDLEAAGTVVLEGPPEAARAIARAVIAGLAVSAVADRIQVVATGADCYGFANEERVQPAADGEAAGELAATIAAGVRAALDTSAAPSTFALRAERPDELWEPVVVVALSSVTAPGEAAALDELAGGGGRGVALLTDVPVAGARWRLRLDGANWRLEPLGLTVEPRGLAADELADAGALLADACVEPKPITRVARPEPAAGPFVEPRWELLVRLLGSVDVVDRHGRPVAFERAKALELVVWLAQHRQHPTRTAARTALWESAVRDATFANVVSDARRGLARLVPPPDGHEWIARTYAEELPLHALVLTDADLLAAGLEHARRQPDEMAIETLRHGLELVRDLPYVGTSYLWPDGEALPSHLTLLVINSSIEMATRCLQLADVDGCFWATAQGIRVLPAHEELVCLRMRAHARRGHLAGVRLEYESYERAITSDPWGDGEPSPKVVSERNDLLRPVEALSRGLAAS